MLPSCIARTLSIPLSGKNPGSLLHTVRALMGHENLHPNCPKMSANFRLCNVSGYTTELLEIRAQNPTLHVLIIPGNPGVVTFYREFVDSLYELLAVGHISHTKKNWENGRLFSLQEQIDHKVDFIKSELQTMEIPIILVGHSIGSYISIEMLRSFEQVIYCIGLYPFLALNAKSWKQSMIAKIAAQLVCFLMIGVCLSGAPVGCIVLSSVVALLGLLPSQAARLVVKNLLGKSWSATAVEATATHLLQYHVMRNMLFMAMTEFERFSKSPNWEMLRGNQDQITFLFGIDDHWGPLTLFEEISKQAPDMALSIEREGHTHGFCCTEAGSLWVAQHVASLIKSRMSHSS